MTGVEILATETIYATILPEWCLVVGVISVIFFALCLMSSLYGSNVALSYIFGALMACGIIFTLIPSIESKTDIDYIEHKVTISDEVSMNEFYEKYEILDQEGKIYTVREK